MQAVRYRRLLTMDTGNVIERLVDTLDRSGASWCVIGGQAVNAYVDPLVSLGLDVVIAVDRVAEVLRTLQAEFTICELEHSLNLSSPLSDLRGKVWAAQDAARRPSKRQKDLADVARLVEAHPGPREMVPADIAGRLVT